MFVAPKIANIDIYPQLQRERPHQITVAAFALISEHGLEGFRVRDVAERVGINISTLHYHFKTKQNLIEAVLRYAIHQIATTHDPSLRPPQTAREKLHQMLVDHYYQHTHHPNYYLVIAEITLRSFRDPAVRTIVEKQDALWLLSIETILKEGIDAGEFKGDLVPTHMANHMILLLRGTLLSPNFTREHWEHMTRQIFLLIDA